MRLKLPGRLVELSSGGIKYRKFGGDGVDLEAGTADAEDKKKDKKPNFFVSHKEELKELFPYLW